MNITYRNAVKQTKKFQQGGPVDAPADASQAPVDEGTAAAEPAPEEGAQEDPIMQLAQVFAQGLQNQDCQMLAQGAQMFLQLLQQAQGGAQTVETQGEPVFKKGGKLAYRIKK